MLSSLKMRKLHRKPSFVSFFCLAFLCVGAQANRERAERQAESEAPLMITITTIESEPYLTIRDGDAEGNDRFEGYIPDLVKMISQSIPFDYKLQLVGDDKYGMVQNGTWSGMIGELISGDVDMAAAPLIITSTREEVVDFSKPFMSSVTKVILKKPSAAKSGGPNIFAFLQPFTVEVWICIIIALLVVGLVVYFLGKVSPYETTGKTLDNGDHIPGHQWNRFNVRNSLWFALSTFTLQGYRRSPRSVSVRVLSAFWFFFVLVVLFAYLSNLSPFLTVEKTVVRARAQPMSIEELSQQTAVSYGAVRSGSTSNTLRNSYADAYRKMWNFMASTPSVFVDSAAEGVERVRNSGGEYAFIGEGADLEYLGAKPPCDLAFLPGSIAMRSYGFAFPQYSILRDQVSNALLALQEDGSLQVLKQKWWSGSCYVEDVSAEAEPAAVDEVQRPRAIPLMSLIGAWIFLVIGIVLSVLVVLCECVLVKKCQKEAERVPESEPMGETEASGV